MFKETQPILGTRDIQCAIGFYTRQLGFKLAFSDNADPPNYVGFRRDAVELHMQFQFEYEMETIRLRFLMEDPDALFDEYCSWSRLGRMAARQQPNHGAASTSRAPI